MLPDTILRMSVVLFDGAKHHVKVYQNRTAVPRPAALYVLDTWQMSENRRIRDRYALMMALVCFALFVAITIYFSARVKG